MPVWQAVVGTYVQYESERMVGLRVAGSEIGRVAPGARRGEDLMAQAAQKITLSSSRDIPFDKLVLSQSNVRRIKAGVSVEELAEDIARRGLLQGLSVRPVLDADGVAGEAKAFGKDCVCALCVA